MQRKLNTVHTRTKGMIEKKKLKKRKNGGMVETSVDTTVGMYHVHTNFIQDWKTYKVRVHVVKLRKLSIVRRIFCSKRISAIILYMYIILYYYTVLCNECISIDRSFRSDCLIRVRD
jgi:hypothetical protein